ncbi:TIGR02611 family protein [Paractinoplanes hotanensis]|uniref:TIGR02611 family protein n=1 Tax=Paractinoplanes hotanensis TaxID=2906497 RepID=A0ABT0YFB1_9ACTN|nr:TIGR02611 family protein [Actinoplanes hotanensis]MCM4084745.1 TIGR02611 family protein [Actinoplanes hotanensis]
MTAKPDQEQARPGVLDKIRANPTGKLALKISIATLGAIVVAVGIVLIPFPGPGWAIVIAGLAIWAIEFAWARHLLEFTKKHVLSWTHWIARQSWPVKGLVGLVGFVFVSAIVYISVRLSLGIDLIDKAREYLA